MAFLNSLSISGSALSAQRTRSDIILQNIAHAETTRTVDGTPYRRQIVSLDEKTSFKTYLGEATGSRQPAGVRISSVTKDITPLTPIYDPSHPDSNEQGYYYMPNVDRTKEMLDLMEATRSYDANVTALNAIKAMASKALEIGK